MTTAHKPATPLPFWMAATTVSAINAEGWAVGGGNTEAAVAKDRANAAYIAHAANAYPKLVEALRKVDARFHAFDSQHPSLCTNEAARQLLAEIQADLSPLLRELGEAD